MPDEMSVLLSLPVLYALLRIKWWAHKQNQAYVRYAHRRLREMAAHAG